MSQPVIPAGGPNAMLEEALVKQLLRTSGAFGTGSSGTLYADMFVDALAQALAQNGGLGIMERPGTRAGGAVLPASTGLTSGFGPRADPLTGQASEHHGWDLAAPTGSPFHTASDGIVTRVGRDEGYGNFVEVSHPDGTHTLYAHAEEVTVRAGQAVRRGEQLGRVGQTGRATGPHLHLEVRVAGRPVDPGRALIAYRTRAEELVAGKR
ncbi:MAG: peptidoglycan DD-metalloendopeptidase family protein [Myxococcota bacterium]